jgi:hypothetical protein
MTETNPLDFVPDEIPYYTSCGPDEIVSKAGSAVINQLPETNK